MGQQGVEGCTLSAVLTECGEAIVTLLATGSINGTLVGQVAVQRLMLNELEAVKTSRHDCKPMHKLCSGAAVGLFEKNDWAVLAPHRPGSCPCMRILLSHRSKVKQCEERHRDAVKAVDARIAERKEALEEAARSQQELAKSSKETGEEPNRKVARTEATQQAAAQLRDTAKAALEALKEAKATMLREHEAHLDVLNLRGMMELNEGLSSFRNSGEMRRFHDRIEAAQHAVLTYLQGDQPHSPQVINTAQSAAAAAAAREGGRDLTPALTAPSEESRVLTPAPALEAEPATQPHIRREVSELRHQVEELQASSMCKICLQEELEVVFEPCHHFVTCQACAGQVQTCPICRSRIIDRIRAYQT
ncbi:hypothetical protein CYMTET_19267 [Cymbomonas tetramitiformis]|uniref:RING-type domain-containing protein n=1 Tax=Cymbomonas tetramitiformis TaxID=36881 RepID=A0AAE0G6F7_9CHLO|nr:hypothetical protein CYMTET_19267 [Cymbomonas tetramitiformis]